MHELALHMQAVSSHQQERQIVRIQAFVSCMQLLNIRMQEFTLHMQPVSYRQQ